MKWNSTHHNQYDIPNKEPRSPYGAAPHIQRGEFNVPFGGKLFGGDVGVALHEIKEGPLLFVHEARQVNAANVLAVFMDFQLAVRQLWRYHHV